MENILNHFLKPTVTFLICGDLNINLLAKSNEAINLLTLMNTYKLTQVVNFPTRITNNTESLRDTAFVDTSMYDKIEIKPFINGLPDHDVQIICLHKSNITSQQNFQKKKSRLINDQTISSFQQLLKAETWNQVYNSSCSNETFNKFQEIFLRHYEASSPVIYVNCRSKKNNWITKGINTGYYLIIQLQKIINPHVVRTMYYACIHSHLKYGITLWVGDPKSRKIFLLQKKIIRIMCKVDQHTSCRNLFRTLGILPLPCLYISEMVCWIKFYCGKLEYNSDLHEHDTCHKTDLHPLICRTNLAKNNGLNMGIALYIKLHQNLKKLDTKHIFKNKVEVFTAKCILFCG